MLDKQTNLPRLRALLEELHGIETHLERFFQLSPDLFCIADADANFIKLNLAWTGLLGWDRDELMTQKFFAFIHPDDIEKTMYILGRMTLESITRFRNRYRCRDGSYVTLEWSTTHWADGFTYASARPIADPCHVCPLVLPGRMAAPSIPALHVESDHAERSQPDAQ